MQIRWKYVAVWVLLLMLLVSCSSSDEPVLNLPPLTLPAPPTPVFSGECNDTQTLESWLQTTQFQQRDFMTLMEEVQNQTEEALYLSVEQLALLHIRVSEEPAPDCATELHQSILSIMNGVVVDLQSHVNVGSGNLIEIVENARVAFNGLLPQQTELLNRLEAQYQN